MTYWEYITNCTTITHCLQFSEFAEKVFVIQPQLQIFLWHGTAFTDQCTNFASPNGMILWQLGCTFFLTRSVEEVGQAGVPGSGQCREDHPLEHAEGRQNGTACAHSTSKYVHGIHTVVWLTQFILDTVSFLPNHVPGGLVPSQAFSYQNFAFTIHNEEGLVKFVTCTFLDRHAIKWVHYRLQTWMTQRLSSWHQAVLATFFRFRKPPHSCIGGVNHSSTHCAGVSLHVMHFTRTPPSAFILQATNTACEASSGHLAITCCLEL